MIKHIVMWSFQDGTQKERDTFLRGLLALKGELDMIKSMEVGVNLNKSNSYDAVLIAEFDSMADLQAYKTNPRHVAVASICKNIRKERACVDIEIP